MPLQQRNRRASLYGTRYALDRFTDADAVSLAAHRLDIGSAWTLNNGAWTISGNKVGTTAANNIANVATIDVGHADVRIRASAKMVTNGSLGLLGRFIDASNYWYCRALSNAFSIFEVVGGTATQRATTAITASVGTEYMIELRFTGTLVTAVWNDANTISYSSANTHPNVTRVGMRGAGSGGTATGMTFDDFEVTRP